MFKTDRERQNDSFIKNIITQKDWDADRKKKITELKEQYKSVLEDYNTVSNIKQYNELKLGGYIRYIDRNDNIKWGGILVKKLPTVDGLDYMLLLNSSMDSFKVCFQKNIIFYKIHCTIADKTRKLFISYLDKYSE